MFKPILLLICLIFISSSLCGTTNCETDCTTPMDPIYAGNNILQACDAQQTSLEGYYCKFGPPGPPSNKPFPPSNKYSNLNETPVVGGLIVDTFNCYVNAKNIGILRTGRCGCPNYCYQYDGKGYCANNTCYCNRGWKGEDCSMVDCTYNTCSGNGICSKINGNDICVCNNGYTGTNCSSRLTNVPDFQNFLPWNQYSSWDEYGNNNPLFFINEVSHVFVKISEEDYQTLLNPKNKNENDYYPASLQIYHRNSSIVMENIGMRIKGGISRSFVKKTWKFKLNYVSGTQFYQMKKFTLKGTVFDPLYLREFLSVRLAYALGMPVQRVSFSKVWINNHNYGAYLNLEDVDDQFLKSRYGSGATNYPLYKCTGVLRYLGDNPETYKLLNESFVGRLRYVYEAQTDAAETMEQGYIPLTELIKTLNLTSPDFESQITKIFDVPMFLKVIAFELLTAQVDGFIRGNNFFLYKGKNNLWQMIRQDFDLSFGFKMGNNNINVDTFNIFCNETLYGDGQVLFKKFLSVPSFKAEYVEIWKSIIANLLDTTNGVIPTGDIVHQKNGVNVFLDIWRQLDFGNTYSDYLNNFENTIETKMMGTLQGFIPYVMNRYTSAKNQIADYEADILRLKNIK